MKRAQRRKYTSDTFSTESYEGETIEHKVQRIVLNKEPIEDGAEIIYTEKKTVYYRSTISGQTSGKLLKMLWT